MLRICYLLLLFSFTFLFLSCRNTVEQRYFADMPDGGMVFDSVALPCIPLSADEDISVEVVSQSPEAAVGINTHGRDLKNMIYKDGQEALALYHVDPSGCITLPLLGVVKVEGMTLDSLSSFIAHTLADSGFVKDAQVSVRRQNACVFVVGEVKRPGKCMFLTERMTIFDALSQVGDATMYALRSNVVVMRRHLGTEQFYDIDLTSQTLFNSPVYYLYPNDVVYVTPNKKRMRQADYDEYIPRYISMGVSAVRVVSLINYVKSTRHYYSR